MKKTKKSFELKIYLSVIGVILIALFGILKITPLKDIGDVFEHKTFDIRQNIVSKYHNPKDNLIKIVAIDDKSYRDINERYGDWPPKRDYWTELLYNLEKYNPKVIVFDMTFVDRGKQRNQADRDFADLINKYDNVILSLIVQQSNKDKDILNIMNNTVTNENIFNRSDIKGVGLISLIREIKPTKSNLGLAYAQAQKDGTIRFVPPIFVIEKSENEKYFCKTIGFQSVLKYLNIDKNDFEIRHNKFFKNYDLIINDEYKIPLSSESTAILNWYNQDFEKISAVDVINNENYIKDKLENKIVFVGSTTPKLNDIHVSPKDKSLPGVEFHVNFASNFLDKSFILKTPVYIDIILALILSLFTIFSVKQKNIFVEIFLYLFVILFYLMFSCFVMHKYNLWISVTFPVITSLIMLISAYIVKYLLKSIDYDETYKLATTDGLTGLYNHRFFQMEMTNNINNFNRYKIPFSLIMIDIDFFKKFNDTYGHQSGDAVLIQVANILKTSIRSTDFACRYGGEEMAIILTNTTKDKAIITANKICENVRNNEVLLATGDKVHVTISVGVSCVDEDLLTPKKMIEYCDKCLYKAKETGRNRVISEI